MSYKRFTSWRFSVLGDWFELTRSGEDCLRVEETRKNGQEDTHASAYVVKTNGSWRFCDTESNSIDEYYGKRHSDAILKHINTHGEPKE